MFIVYISLFFHRLHIEHVLFRGFIREYIQFDVIRHIRRNGGLVKSMSHPVFVEYLFEIKMNLSPTTIEFTKYLYKCKKRINAMPG